MLAPDGNRTVNTIDNPDPTSNVILALLIDYEGRVWLGSGVGLSVLLPDGSIESYTYEDSELIEGAITSLAMDSLGRLGSAPTQAWGCSSLKHLDGRWIELEVAN